MNYRTVAGVAALVLLLPASVSEAADRLPSYRFTTLYSAAHRLLPDLLKGCPTSGQAPAYSLSPSRPSFPTLTDRARWQDRLPWWREEAIEPGTLPPFDQENTFERSLEFGRAYDEAMRYLRRERDGRDVPYATYIACAKNRILKLQRSFGNRARVRMAGLVAPKVIPCCQIQARRNATRDLP